MKKNTYIIIFPILFFSFFFILNNWKNKKDIYSNPVPTEFIQKKNDRKKIKEGRKKWIFDMHKSHPDIDWQEIDK